MWESAVWVQGLVPRLSELRRYCPALWVAQAGLKHALVSSAPGSQLCPATPECCVHCHSDTRDMCCGLGYGASHTKHPLTEAYSENTEITKHSLTELTVKRQRSRISWGKNPGKQFDRSPQRVREEARSAVKDALSILEEADPGSHC